MDEMGMEMFADRKDMKVFARPKDIPEMGNLIVGVPRSNRRCTLIACIALNGETVKSALIIKNKSVNSVIQERGYNIHNVMFFQTESSFISQQVFKQWLTMIFLPHVYEKRRFLRSVLGTFNERAVLILDNCSCHETSGFQDDLRETHNVILMFIPPNSSHLTQPLDVGVFGKTKSLIRSNSAYLVGFEIWTERSSRRSRRSLNDDPSRRNPALSLPNSC